jgi:thymidylate synthase ThyX
MTRRVQILDHGYIEPIESWGSDERIIEAARMSTGKGFLGWGPVHDTQCAALLERAEPVPTAGVRCSCTPGAGDEKLLAFLYNNRHATPFEMAGLVIEVQAPIMVFREWHRHRTQCLSGSTEISLVTPNGTTYKRTIKEIFDLKYGGVVDQAPEFHKNGYSKVGTPVLRPARRKDPWRTRVLPNCQERRVRVLNEETGLYEVGEMADVWKSGTKELYEVWSNDGKSVRVSAEHPFLTRDGWAKVKDLSRGDVLTTSGKVALRARPIPPRLREGIGVWTSMMRIRLIKEEDVCYLCKEMFPFKALQLDHVVPVADDLKKALDEKNLKPACKRCHREKTDHEQPDRTEMTGLGARYVRLAKKPVRVSEEETYDMEMRGSHHNYLANGLVVHNSYNEMSARYVPLPDVNYMPTVERCMIVSATNKQAGSVKGADELTHESVLAWLEELADVYGHAERVYQSGLVRGIPKEIARLPVPVGRYSRMRAQATLRNWLAFLTLRSDHVLSGKAAQFEIRQFANEVSNIIQQTFPRTHALFVGT